MNKYRPSPAAAALTDAAEEDGSDKLSTVDRIQYERGHKRYQECSASLFAYLQVEAERSVYGQPGLQPSSGETLVAAPATVRAALIMHGRHAGEHYVVALHNPTAEPPLSFPSSIIKDDDFESGLSAAFERIE